MPRNCRLNAFKRQFTRPACQKDTSARAEQSAPPEGANMSHAWNPTCPMRGTLSVPRMGPYSSHAWDWAARSRREKRAAPARSLAAAAGTGKGWPTPARRRTPWPCRPSAWPPPECCWNRVVSRSCAPCRNQQDRQGRLTGGEYPKACAARRAKRAGNCVFRRARRRAPRRPCRPRAGCA